MRTKLLLIILATLLLAGSLWLVVQSRQAQVRVPDGAQAGDLSLESCTYKVESVVYQAECGTLVVPENRASSTTRLIALPVKRIHATSADPREPIFHLEGGPGESNMDFDYPHWLLADHDLVLVGYRGVDGTPKLDCPEVAAAITGVSGDLLSTESLDHMGAALEACVNRLEAEGVDLAGYTIPEVVEDMEAARAALGYDRIHLLSQSYGTRVAQIYAAMHPESIHRSAMIGVNPPGHLYAVPETADAQVEYYANLCRQDAECSARTPDLAATIRNVNQSMPNRWLFVPIDPGKVMSVAFIGLMNRATAPVVFDVYTAAEQGDPSGLALISLSYDLFVPRFMTWGEYFALGMSADYEPGRDYRAELTAPDATFGSPFYLLIWGSASGHWPPIVMDDEYRQVQPSEVETLLISGSVDFSTPAQFAEQELLPSLRNGKHVIIAEQGHTSDFWSFQPEAAEQLLTSFYATGVADDSLYIYLPMDFEPTLRAPTLAKIILAVGVLLMTLLGWAVWGLVRRIQQQRVTLAASGLLARRGVRPRDRDSGD